MTSISLATSRSGIETSSESTAFLASLLVRLAAWRRYRNYPGIRRARRETVFVWASDVVRHGSARL